MTRREPFTFIDFHSNSERKAFCRICEETTGRLNRLLPRYINDILDDKFKVCSYCGELYPIYDIKFVPEYEPKARISENPFESGAKVSVVNKKRTIRNKETNDENIPNLAGREDTELKTMLRDRPGILNNLNDEEIGE
jgi:hypothetical protein